MLIMPRDSGGEYPQYFTHEKYKILLAVDVYATFLATSFAHASSLLNNSTIDLLENITESDKSPEHPALFISPFI
jgi:hypothetical protein